MNRSNHLFSAVGFFVVLLFFLMGSFFLALPFSPHVNLLVLQFFSGHPQFFFLVGTGLCMLGLCLLTAFYFLYQGKYYQVRMKVRVSEAFLKDSMASFFQEHFPTLSTTPELLIHADQKIEMILHLPGLPLEKHEELLERVEKEVGHFLMHQLGYSKDFLVTVCFS